MIDQNGINNFKDNQNITQSDNPLQNETINNFVPPQNLENEVINTNTPPMENIEEEIHNDAYFEEEIKKSNLVFDEKSISAAKLYLHLSGPYEIFLMIIGIICSLGAGVAAPLMCYLFGDMANDFSQANVDENQVDLLERLMECKNVEEAQALAPNADAAWSYGVVYNMATEMFVKFDDNVDDLVRKLLIIGASMFVAFGGQKFFLNYCGMRQLHHLKEKYFAVILRQEQAMQIMLLNLVQKSKHNLNR